MRTAIELKNVVVYSNDYRVLDDVSLTIPAGQFTLILGPTGCGKSTLLKVIAGILIPDKGQVLIEGREYSAYTEKELIAIRRRNGFVFQDSALWANKSILENLSLPLHFHFPELLQSQIEERVTAVLDEITLLDSLHLRPAQLSTGEQKMVSFRRALITDPDVIFLDEPTASVDLSMRRKMMRVLWREKQRHATMVAVTHDAEILSLFTDYLVVLKQGRLLQAGPKDEVRFSTFPAVREILSEVTMAETENAGGNTPPDSSH
ncbi:MAG TPA: ATP-binding cassette domain-containing protein [Spirochaetia bacterium]|nr:ATP-binding cassette domain-containing protein [Spirochaetia bacterium]